VTDQSRRDIDNASARLLSQHLLDRELAHEEKTFDIDRSKRPQIIDRVICEMLREIYASVVDQRVDRSEFVFGNFDDLATVAASAMLPSKPRRAYLKPRKLTDLLMFREFATTIVIAIQKGRHKAAPMPREPPVTITVLWVFYHACTPVG